MTRNLMLCLLSLSCLLPRCGLLLSGICGRPSLHLCSRPDLLIDLSPSLLSENGGG